MTILKPPKVLFLAGKIIIVCSLLFLCPVRALATTTSTAESVAAYVGYAVSGQQEHVAALDNVQCTMDVAQRQGAVENGFFLFSSVITHQRNLEDTTVIEGMYVHKDRLQRKIFSLFVIEYSGSDHAVVRKVRVSPAKAAKPHIEMFYVPTDMFTAELVTKLSHAKALELAVDKGVSLEQAGLLPQRFLALAFQMNKENSGSRLEIVLSDKSGVTTSRKTGTTITGNGWVYAALEADFSLDAGPERFFNVVRQLPSEEGLVVAVYSSHSLTRQVRQALREKGYDPGSAGEITTRTIKSFQKKTGLHQDGEISPSLLRVLKTPGMESAVAFMQQGLNTLGYDAGPVDGLLAAGSKKALQAFQEDAGLPQDGVLTASLLCRIYDVLLFRDFFAAAADTIGSQVTTGTAEKSPVSPYPDRMWPNQVTF